MLRKSYNWILNFADHPKALWMLVVVSFAESSFFPLPPDPLYFAMLLSRNDNPWRLAFICTVSSVLGGLLGYWIGFSLYETWGTAIIDFYGLAQKFENFQNSFQQWGFWIVALKGLTPIPYKLVTICSGVAKLDLKIFVLASLIARGFRFFLVAFLLRRYGLWIRDFIERHLGLVTLAGLLILLAGFFLLK